MIFFRVILSGSILLKEPTAATEGDAEATSLFKTIKGRGGKEIGAYIEAMENRPAWRNLSILCLSEFMLSEENIGLQSKQTQYTLENLQKTM